LENTKACAIKLELDEGGKSMIRSDRFSKQCDKDTAVKSVGLLGILENVSLVKLR
jgi:hypothetical protein